MIMPGTDLDVYKQFKYVDLNLSTVQHFIFSRINGC